MSGGAVVVAPGGEIIGDELRTALAREGLGDDPAAGRLVLVGIGRGARDAIREGASDPRCRALALVAPELDRESLETIAEWTAVPILACADPADRAALRASVDAYLTSPNARSGLLVGPVAVERVSTWLAARVAAAGRMEAVVLTTADGWEIHGQVLVPESAAPVPGVVLLHSGRSDRFAFGRLERLLLERGLAVCNIDWRGRGRSTNRGSYFDLTDDERAHAYRDATAAFAHLAARPEVDAERLGAVGVVHGAEHAVRGAMEHRGVRALVVLTGYQPRDEGERAHLTSGAVDVYYVTSESHTVTSTAMRDLYDASPGRRTRFVSYPGGAIGYQLFEIDAGLEPAIVEWLAEVLCS